MSRLTLLSLCALCLVTVLAIQVPFKWDTNPGSQEKSQSMTGVDDRTEWNLGKVPHPNSTDHLVFETVYSLLQHWPNTRMRNGHNIVPGIIPKGTLLYRGSNSYELPPGPDWVATDPEHSYLFCRDDHPPGSLLEGCWHLTLVTTRPLKVVYFDGSSAAKIQYGSMDTQDLIAWGRANFDSVFSERERAEKLCKWAEKFNVDAFIRMEMDFEAILCDFTAGVSVASLANLVNRWSIPSMSSSTSFEVMNSGSWHNRFPGETRVRLDLSGIISFYDTKLVPSLVSVRVGQERWDHRVGNISSEDLAGVKSRLEAIMVRPPGLSSGVDWGSLVQTIVDRFSGRLELTRHLLNSSTIDPIEILGLANQTQTQLRIMLTPYILLSAMPTGTADETDLDWTIPMYKLCATVHTKSLESELDTMTDSEKLLLQAVRGTSREICRVVTKMWAAGVYAGTDQLLNTKESPDIAEVKRVWSEWEEDLNRLMTWLDWSVWIKCNPDCGPEEMCYLPTWPSGFPRVGGRGPAGPADPERPPHRERLAVSAIVVESLAEQTSNIVKPALDDWVRPQPRCIPRVAPYETFNAFMTPRIGAHEHY